MRPQARAVLPVMLVYSPGSKAAGAHLVGGLEQLGRLAEVVAGLEGPGVGLGHHGRRSAKRLAIHSRVGSIGRV